MVINQPSLTAFKTIQLHEIGGSRHYRGFLEHLVDTFPIVTKIPAGDGSQFNPLRLNDEQMVIYTTESSYHEVYVFRVEIIGQKSQRDSYFYLFHLDSSTQPLVINAYFFRVTPKLAILTTKDIANLASMIDDNFLYVENIRMNEKKQPSHSPNLCCFSLTDHNLRQVAQFFLNLIKTIRYG